MSTLPCIYEYLGQLTWKSVFKRAYVYPTVDIIPYMIFDLTDRKNCFYWQTDRKLSTQDYAQLFLKRQEVPIEELSKILSEGISLFKNITSLQIEEPDENVVRGNVNIVRKVHINGQTYVVRMHPKKVKNGYFYVEKTAHEAAIKSGLPVANILEVHEAQNEEDMDFVLLSILPGKTLDNYLKKDPTNESLLLYKAGTLMTKIHEISVEKFGSFDNVIAKEKNKLVGLHTSYKDFIWTGLEENLERLIKYNVITPQHAEGMKSVFEKYNFEPLGGPKLIHNDYADWNLLTDGNDITGILDWDECHGGDPIADLACWSTFFNEERFKPFLEGYTSVVSLPNDYESRFHFYRLRYTICKMALRVKVFSVDPAESVKARIEVGKKALKTESEFFGIQL
jgi:aminoglycoside phosphotransferase (APT) family kinase protein